MRFLDIATIIPEATGLMTTDNRGQDALFGPQSDKENQINYINVIGLICFVHLNIVVSKLGQ